MAHDLAYYRGLPYERVWEVRVDDGERYYVVRLRDIPRVSGAGVTKDEAIGHLREAFDDYVTWRLHDGLSVAAPSRCYATRRPGTLHGLESARVTATACQTTALRQSATEHAAAAYEWRMDCREVACA